MGAGKSTVGPALAGALAVPFVDLDDVLAARFGPIPSQFEAVGESGFRRREAQCLQQVLGWGVLALGGGAYLDDATKAWLRDRATTVFLDVPLSTLRQRVGHGTSRPLWDDTVLQRYQARLPHYRQADHTVDADRPVADIVRDILECL